MSPRKVAAGLAAGIAATALAAAVLSGCGGAATSEKGAAEAAPAAAKAAFPVTITDSASRTITIDAEPKRIVSLAPANTEIVYAIGLGDRLVGVTTWCDYPVMAKKVPKVGDFTSPNMEAIAAAKPDVVLLTSGVQADVVKRLEEMGAKAIVVDAVSVEKAIEGIGTVGRALGAEPRASEIQATMREELADIAAKIAGRKPRRAFVEIGVNPLFTVGKGTLLDDMLRLAGGTNVVTLEGYTAYSTEQLVKSQPDVYLGTMSSIGDPEVLVERPGYDSIRAVEQGSVYPLDDNIVSRPGPRAVQGVRLIAEILHPEAYGK